MEILVGILGFAVYILIILALRKGPIIEVTLVKNDQVREAKFSIGDQFLYDNFKVKITKILGSFRGQKTIAYRLDYYSLGKWKYYCNVSEDTLIKQAIIFFRTKEKP